MTHANICSQSPKQPPETVSCRAGKAKEYQAKRQWLFFGGIFLQGAGLLLVWWTGLTFLFKTWALAVFTDPWGVVLMYFAFFSAFFLLLDLPFAFYSGYLLEKKYNLTNHRTSTWAAEEAKKDVLSFAFSILLIQTLYFLIRSLPECWWLAAWGGWILVSFVLGKVAHILILPLFYKCERLENDVLRVKLRELFLKNNFPVKEIYRINLSKTTKKSNAAVSGFGNTRRILLADTLLESFTPDEIVSVVAHELGHAKKHHIMKGMFFSSLLSLILFYAAFRMLRAWAGPAGFDGPGDIAAFPLLGLLSLGGGILLLPLSNIFSRFQEREADDFASRETIFSGAFASALTKLGNMNLADFAPHPLIEFLLYSHPALGERIRRAESHRK